MTIELAKQLLGAGHIEWIKKQVSPLTTCSIMALEAYEARDLSLQQAYITFSESLTKELLKNVIF